MHIVQFQEKSGQQVLQGVKIGDAIYQFGRSLPAVDGIESVFANWSCFQDAVLALDSAASAGSAATNAGADFSADAVRLVCPVPLTAKTICIGLNYRDHAIESGMAIPSEPVVFCKLNGALCGPGDSVELPAVSQQVDYEAELVMVIGKPAWRVTAEEAMQHVFGYSCGHDVSARDWQIGRPGGQWLLGKSFPNFAPLGPGIVPAENIADPCNLKIQLRVNGETLQDSSTAQLIFNPVELIMHLSQCFVLQPGDVIYTGTPPGVGMARKPQRFLQDGDVAEVDIESIGVLSNTFRAAM